MQTIKVKELMLKLDDYAVVDEDATLLEAINILEESQKKLPKGHMMHRAVLIKNKSGKIIGKLGHLAFLNALEPKYGSLGDLKTLARAGLSSDFVNNMMDTFNFWDYSIEDVCKRAAYIKVKDVAHPVEEHIDENATISQAVHKFLMWQTLSILVVSGDDIVGVLRLSDVYSHMANMLKTICCNE